MRVLVAEQGLGDGARRITSFHASDGRMRIEGGAGEAVKDLD